MGAVVRNLNEHRPVRVRKNAHRLVDALLHVQVDLLTRVSTIHLKLLTRFTQLLVAQYPVKMEEYLHEVFDQHEGNLHSIAQEHGVSVHEMALLFDFWEIKGYVYPFSQREQVDRRS